MVIIVYVVNAIQMLGMGTRGFSVTIVRIGHMLNELESLMISIKLRLN
mgnify:CR=1 FL=1